MLVYYMYGLKYFLYCAPGIDIQLLENPINIVKVKGKFVFVLFKMCTVQLYNLLWIILFL